MRSYGLVLAALALASLPASAQQAQQRPPRRRPPTTRALDQHLDKWEAAMKTVETLGAQLTRIDKDPVYEHVQKLTGAAYYMKAGSGPTAQNLALLEMKLDGQKEPKEKFICTGTYIYSVPAGAKRNPLLRTCPSRSRDRRRGQQLAVALVRHEGRGGQETL